MNEKTQRKHTSQMARIRGKDTSPEVILRRALWLKGFRYRIRHRIVGTPDVAFCRSKIAVFVDGCFWHGCPEHYRRPPSNRDYWDKKLERNKRRDERVDGELTAQGWIVIRVWEHDVLQDVVTVVKRIEDTIWMRDASQRQSRHRRKRLSECRV
jgi:DNA mismatch endonuclease, patch repair protein